MWQRLTSSPHAVWLTHGSLILMTAAVFALLVRAPFWILFVPGVILLHRIGVMIHEYIHGIPFRRYAHCLNVISFYDGIADVRIVRAVPRHAPLASPLVERARRLGLRSS
jgi:hypothetical protein